MKARRYALFLVVLMSIGSPKCSAQGEGWNWYFGSLAGLNFSGGSPEPLTNSVLSSYEGTSVASDSSGNLLMYTNGYSIADATHSIMPNSTGLWGDSSSTQGAIILPLPGSDSLYYVFNVDLGAHGFTYSVVDLSLNGGTGDVIPALKNIPVRMAREKITAVRHANGVDFWILIVDWADDDIYAYLFDGSGLNTTPVISNVGPFHQQQTDQQLGYLKASRQNNRIAVANFKTNNVVLAVFHNDTGIADQRVAITGTASTFYKTYGAEFSPDGSKLYVSTLASPHKIFQFDLSLADGAAMFAARDTIAYVVNGADYYFGALQIGPDGRIYSAMTGNDSLGVINDPDAAGTLCNYEPSAVGLAGRICRLGLPNFVSDIVIPVTTGLPTITAPLALQPYPNPCDAVLDLSMPGIGANDKVTLVILDGLGRIVQHSAGNWDQIFPLATSSLAPGLYRLHITTEKSSSLGSFVVFR